ncbi:stress-response A/B barrel domain-containing protein UP3-like [Tasmannia lanceolata]|uniref:stress-response A/B barrel domain-containing protein UP3-like n=1 Tax=Tasmannia lanceolata TaxID=3420 RepID=UPI0040628210
MLRLKSLSFFHHPPSTQPLALFFTLPTSISHPLQKPSLSLFSTSKPLNPKSRLSRTFSSSSTLTPPPMSKTVEHVVLFHVKDHTDPSKIDAMISNLRSLTSLDFVLHLTAGPIFRNRSSSSSKFTHLLHSRYKTKEDLNNYSAHPNHTSVVRDFVLPICDDIMAVDWMADVEEGQRVPRLGAAMRLTFLKPKEGLGDLEREEILGVIGGIKSSFPSIDQISFGENFSPARAKGFTLGFLSVFPGLKELDALDSNEEVVESQKEKVRPLLDSVIVLDYLIPLPSGNL